MQPPRAEAEVVLRDCFESTDWSVLQDSFGEDIEGVTDCTTDYLNFCMYIVAPTKAVLCFPNNKPWITSNVKYLPNKKKRAFKEVDQGELKIRLKEAKELCRRKVEQKLQDNNMREVWDGMKTITGCKKSSSTVGGDVVRANQFNHFYNRFDNPAPCVNAYPTPIHVPPPPAAVTCSPHATTPTTSPPPDPPLPLL